MIRLPAKDYDFSWGYDGANMMITKLRCHYCINELKRREEKEVLKYILHSANFI